MLQCTGTDRSVILSHTLLCRCLLVTVLSLLFGRGWSLHSQDALPMSPKASSALTMSQIQHELDTGHADAALRGIDAMPPQSGRSRLRGSALYALGQMREAEAELAKAVQEDPKDLAALQLRGLVLFRLGRPGEAVPLLEQAHTWTAETRTDPAYVLALCYIDTHRFDDARRAFAEQYGFPPNSAAAHLLAARMLLRREYVPNALEETRKAIDLDPSLPLAHRLLGEIDLASGHVEDATAEFEKERQRNPMDGSTYDRLGDAYARAGDYPRAEQMLERALLLEPTATGPYILLGKVLLKRQDAASAAGYLERAEKMDPSNPITHSLLGQAYRAMGRVDEARRETDIFQGLQSDAAPKLQPIK